MMGQWSREWQGRAREIAGARWTCVTAITLVALHVGVRGLASPEHQLFIYRELGLSDQGLAQGKLWQLLTYGLLHASGWHLGLNVLMLLSLGPRLERIGGATAWWRVVLSGLVGGGVAHWLLLGAGDRILVGASGSVLALLFWVVTVAPDSCFWPIGVSGRRLGHGILLASLFLVLLDPAVGIPGLADLGQALGSVLGQFVFQVSHACHLGGATVGILWARKALGPRWTLARLQAERARREG